MKMICYSVQPRDRIFVKGYGFSAFAKNAGRNIAKNISKTLISNTVRNALIMLISLLQMQLKVLQNKQFKSRSRSNWRFDW